MSFKTQMDILRMNEPVQNRAKFWTSYIRALKGTDDMRASEDWRPRSRGYPRLFPDIPEDFYKPSSIYDDPRSDAAARIVTPGYRYDPVSRDIYGYSPRPYGSEYRPIYSRAGASLH